MLSCNIWGQVCLSAFHFFYGFLFEGWSCNYRFSWFSFAFCEITLCSAGWPWWHVYATFRERKEFWTQNYTGVEGGFAVSYIKLLGALEPGKNAWFVFARKFHTVLQKDWLSPISALRTECISSECWSAAWFRWSLYSKTELGWCLNTPGACSWVGSHG